MTAVKHYDTIIAPVITEKSTVLSEQNKVVFRVPLTATKGDVKAAVEALFKVKVLGVNVSTTKAKEKSRNRRRGRVQGYTSPWRKAVVTVRPTDKIEFFEGV